MALKQTLGRVLQLASGQFLPVWKSCVGFSDSQDSIRNLSEVIQRLLSPSIGCWKRQAQWEDRRKASNPIFVLGEDQQTAFTELIDCLTSAPVLGYADYSKPFDLHVDVSADGLGSVLCQWQCDQQRILTFASRGPCVSESRYPAHKLEFLCLKWVVSEKFKDYGGGGVNQAYSRLSTIHGHITNCKLDSVVYAGVGVMIKCGPVLFRPNDLCRTILGCQATDSILPQVSQRLWASVHCWYRQ